MRSVLLAAAAVCACGPSTPYQSPTRTVEGHVAVPEGSSGDAYLFLFDPSAPPQSGGAPKYASAVPRLRLSSGDTRYVFADVAPGSYLQWGYLDTDHSFTPEIDLLTQPTAGDFTGTSGQVDVETWPTLLEEYPTPTPVPYDPPAFEVVGAPALTTLPATLTTFDLQVRPVGPLEWSKLGFVVSFGDANHDGAPDDLNGDGLPDLYPQIFFHRLHKSGEEPEVILPAPFNPLLFYLLLGNDPSAEVVVTNLPVIYLAQAQAVTYVPGVGQVFSALPSVPSGDYELVVMLESGQVWRVPNALGDDSEVTRRVAGGPDLTQAIRFNVP